MEVHEHFKIEPIIFDKHIPQKCQYPWCKSSVSPVIDDISFTIYNNKFCDKHQCSVTINLHKIKIEYIDKYIATGITPKNMYLGSVRCQQKCNDFKTHKCKHHDT